MPRMRLKITRTIGLLLALLTLLISHASGKAQEVRWRTDYNTARKEATQKNRPLVLDFGTENCPWCKKLDATTFQEPAIAGLMNERFIPLKLDGKEASRLLRSCEFKAIPRSSLRRRMA